MTTEKEKKEIKNLNRNKKLSYVSSLWVFLLGVLALVDAMTRIDGVRAFVAMFLFVLCYFFWWFAQLCKKTHQEMVKH